MLIDREWDRPRPVGGAASYYPPLVFPCLAEEQQQKQELRSQQDLQQDQFSQGGACVGGPGAVSQRSGGLWGSQGVVLQRDVERTQVGPSSCKESAFFSAPSAGGSKSSSDRGGATLERGPSEMQDVTRRYMSERSAISEQPGMPQTNVGLWGGPGTEVRREASVTSASTLDPSRQQGPLNTMEVKRQFGDRQHTLSNTDASSKFRIQDDEVRGRNGLVDERSNGFTARVEDSSRAYTDARQTSSQDNARNLHDHRDAQNLVTPQQQCGMVSFGGEDVPSMRADNNESKSSESSSQQVEVRVPHGDAPPPWRKWQDVSFSSNLLSRLIGAGFPAPTPIQQHSWAIVTKGHDLIGIAKTGSGKTLAFLLPAFSRLLESRADPRAPPAILVLAPTRELACQIEQEAKQFGSSSGIKAVCLYGGAPKGPQLAELRTKPQLVVATPGRLNDLLEPPAGMSLAVDVKGVRFLVLDEADRMLDMGFEPQIRKIISGLPQERQTMMFTATWPPSIRRLASEFLKEPVEVRVGEVEQLSVNADIEQQVVFCSDQVEKQSRLDEVLREMASDDQAVVFVNTKRMCDSLSFRTPNSAAIHGDKDQRERDSVLAAFKSGSKRVLVATDVAARGLDIKAVGLVVNFEPPNREEDYVHRVGRTGRAGRKGKALTFLTDEDGSAARFIADVLRRMSLPLPPELERKLTSGELRSGGGGRARSVSRGPVRRNFDNDDFDFGDMGGSRLSGGFGRSIGGSLRNDCPNDCPTW